MPYTSRTRLSHIVTLVTCCALAGLLTTGCADSPPDDGYDGAAQVDMASDTTSDGWIVLFDGRSMDAFRGFKQDSMPTGWVIRDGAMYNQVPGHGADIVTRETFADFELAFDWKLDAGGNSGVMFRVDEEPDYPWVTGPEYQLLDNDGHPDALEGPDRMAGANYDVHDSNPDVARPAGEWNTGRILVQGNHVEHWLNDVLVVEYELFSDEWTARVAASKWAKNPDYGRRATGHIAFQGDHEPVWLRNVKVRRL